MSLWYAHPIRFSSLHSKNSEPRTEQKLPLCGKNSKGFTLIELLVAISIIAVIFGVVITSAGAIQRSGRNTQRQTDLRNLQSALQQYYADNNSYPSSTLTPGSPLSSGSKVYLSKIPGDPNGNAAYFYQYQSNSSSTTANDCSSTGTPAGTPRCNYYYLCASLEGGIPSSAKSCTTINSSYNFLLTPD